MILWTNKVKLATLVLLVVMPSLANAQIADEVVSNAPDTGYLTSEVASPEIEVGQPGEYFEQSADCGCQQSSCGRQCGNGLGLRGIARALRPFGDTSGYESYRSVFGGWTEAEGDFDNGSGAPDFPFEFNDGFVLGTAKGIYLNSNTRVEREFSWRNNTSESINGVVPPLDLDGRLNTFSSMVNVIREFRPNSRLKPYVGVGAGASRQDGEFNANGIDLELDDWAFAYQGIAGLKFQKSCRTSLFVEYRYLGNTETELESSFGGGPSTDSGDFDYTAENVVFGIQFKR